MTVTTDQIPARLAEISAMEAEGRIDEAARAIDALGIDTLAGRPAGLHLAGIIAARKADYPKAEALMARAAALAEAGRMDSATCGEILRNLMEVLRRQHRPGDAIAIGLRATNMLPGDTASLNNLGLAYLDAGDTANGIACLDRAIAHEPDAAHLRFGRGEVFLALGDYAEGWQGYTNRFRMAGVPPPVPPEVLAKSGATRWNGQPLHGTLLVAADQGIGDVVQFARYLPWAAERCHRLIVAARPEMHPFVRQFPVVAQCVADWTRLDGFQAWTAMSDLPMLAGTRADTIPADSIPYLRADASRIAHWRARLTELCPPTGRRVGLVWAGSASHANDFARSTRLATLAPMLDAPDIVWIALQKGGPEAEIAGHWGRSVILNIGAEIGDFDDTMAVLSLLDLVISVDTSVIHIAGAMGRPAWMLTPFRADWRWGLAGEQTPWYPSLRIKRQQAPGDWAGLARAVGDALSDLA